MKYIKKGTPFIAYPNGMHQIFLHNPKMQINKENTISLYVEKKVNDNDLKLIDFIWKAGFCVKEHIHRFALSHDIEYLDNALKILFENHLINKFYLCESKDVSNSVPADAEIIYCLAEGGRQLIENFCDDYISWGVNKIAMSSNVISKTLIDTELHLDIIYNTKQYKVEHDKMPSYYVSQKNITLSSHYRFALENGNFYLITDVIRSTDDILKIRPRLQLINSLLGKQLWRRYYPDTQAVPMLILIVETDEHAYQIAQEIIQTTEIRPENFRITTNDRMKRGISNADSFLEYDKDSEALYPTSIALFQ